MRPLPHPASASIHPASRRRSQSPGWLPFAAVLVLTFPWVEAAAAQSLELGAHAAALVTRVDPALLGDARTEAVLVHPMLLARAAWDRLTFQGTLNLEGWTLADGAPAPGNSGEGFVDRRHPHTYLHEAALTVRFAAGAVGGSVTAGRGFVPFGTDDPMVRPFAVYPANHHWSQILERLVLIGALRRGPVLVEAGVFNGDEPGRPLDLGRLSRVGDSWSVRGTVAPRPGLEAQVSHARVTSPEHALGGGLDQRKWSASGRHAMDLAGVGHVYALVEWGETHEYAGGRLAYIFTTVLAEAALERGPWRVAGRYERTTRPEEERLADPFRSARPHGDENIVGATRWNTVTAMAARRLNARGLDVEPFAEAALSRVREITGGIFDPRELYGGERIGTLSLGIRLRAGMQHERMGRYGVAAPAHHMD